MSCQKVVCYSMNMPFSQENKVYDCRFYDWFQSCVPAKNLDVFYISFVGHNLKVCKATKRVSTESQKY